jgi:AcrR family transcriptional regulator
VTTTRRANPTYYDGDLRRDLLDTALELVAREGPSAVSLRSLARRLGVSHAAPANHFPDKASLFTAIAIEGFRLLAAAIEDGARRPFDEIAGEVGALLGSALGARPDPTTA